MSEIREDGARFVGYDYKEVDAEGTDISFYLDCYENFGWVLDGRSREDALLSKGKLVLRRDRKIINKAELTRLQRHFEACVRELDELERSKTAKASICSITVGLIGTAFMAGSTFAVTHTPPLIALSILLAVPGFMGWIVPIFLYRRMVSRRTEIVNELKERKYDEIYEICEKGHQLLL